jgi:5-oxopent-3-ene-1,2,5-tricarboxylate decarboxylase/2-hydroxyhepta-2,4-diene-1,7-dioate isomerase
MRFKCRDSFCPIGPVVVPPQSVANPDALNITVAVDGVVLQRCTTAGLIRPIAQLMADVTEFMTLHPGDVLTVGVAAGSPRARAGQRVSITIDGIGQLVNTLIPEEQS